MKTYRTKSYRISSTNWNSQLNFCEICRKKAVVPTYCNLYAYGANNPVKYTDPDGRIQKDAQGKIRHEHICTFSYSNTNSKTDVFVLYTDKGNPIIGITKTKNFTSDYLGKKFADSEYTLQPKDLTNKEYKSISDSLGLNMSRTDNLKTLLNDECKEVSPENAKAGDMFIINEGKTEGNPVFHGEIQKVQKGLFGYKYTVEHNGHTTTYTDKDFTNGFKIYRKNED